MDKIITYIQAYWYALKAWWLCKKYDTVQIEREGMLIAGNLWNKDCIYGVDNFEHLHEEELPRKFKANFLDSFKLDDIPRKFQEQEALYTLVRAVSNVIGRVPVMYAPDGHITKYWAWYKK